MELAVLSTSLTTNDIVPLPNKKESAAFEVELEGKKPTQLLESAPML